MSTINMDWKTFICPICKEEARYVGVGIGTHHFFATHYYMHQLETTALKKPLKESENRE